MSNQVTEWTVEIWADDEFDWGTTHDTYEEAKAEYDKEVGSFPTWPTTGDVRLYETTKVLVHNKHFEQGDEDESGN